MGGQDSPLRLRSPIPEGSSSVGIPRRVSVLQGGVGTSLGFGGSGGRDAEERSYRTGVRSSSRFLFSRLPCAQGDRGLEADLRLIGLKSFPGGDPLPHGDGIVSPGVNGRGGVDGVLRSEGRLFSGSCPPSVPQVHEVRLAGQSFPVSSPVLRPCLSPSGLYQVDGSRLGLGSSPRHTFAPLSRRLARFRSFMGVMPRECQGSSASVFSGGDPDQLVQIRSESQPEEAVFGYGVRHSQGPGFPVARSGQSFSGGGTTISFSQSSTSDPLEVLAGSSSFPSKVGARWAPADAVSTVVPKETLEGSFRSRLVESGSKSSVCGGHRVVVGSGTSLERRSFRGSSPSSNTVLRCFPARVGSSSGGLSGIGSVVFEGKGAPHKSSGASSSLSCPPEFSSGIVRVCGVRDVRQLDCGGLSQEVRGHSFRASVGLGRGGSPVVREPFHLSVPRFRSRSPQCDSGCAQSGMCRDRVDPSSRDLQKDLPGVGVSSSGSVCHSSDTPSAPVCVTSSRSESMETGCILFPVERSGSVRVSSIRSDPSCAGEGSRDSVCEDDTGGTPVATGRLVSPVAGSDSGQSPGSTHVAVPASSTTSSSLPRFSGEAPSSRVATLQRLLRARGFSRKAARLMSNPVRQSSSSVYQAKWRVFCDWCESRGLDPCSAPVVQLAEFFIFLRDTKRLSLSAIRGYRCALAPVLRQSGIDISTDKDLSSLFRSFAVSCPPRSPRLPAWDLSLVLRSLLRPPYEPLRTASMRDVSLKTVFLLALATARRVSGLHGLSAEVRHSQGWTSVTFSFVPDFLAKTQRPGQDFIDEFTIPALLEFVGEQEEDRLLCPVRAVREYLRRTRDCRPACSRLLVTVSDPRRAVHPHTLSKWICQVIRRAYASVSEEECRLVKVKAHEVRAIATSLLFQKVRNLDLVLKAGTWKCMTTFASFYLRDMTHRYLDTFSLGPIVSALKIVK